MVKWLVDPGGAQMLRDFAELRQEELEDEREADHQGAQRQAAPRSCRACRRWRRMNNWGDGRTNGGGGGHGRPAALGKARER